ncbi:MAG: Ig-like domain-containing protein [Lachnospiraceae bacterium]|nr:Ig-like domain-containing protein [Lachnospiraceae bacterium]
MLILDGEGSITATGGYYGAGIGGGYQGAGNNITINGGVVTATGGPSGAGIGGGIRGAENNITISGGTVTATGGTSGAGIGGGYQGAGNKITISGGTVTATGGANGAGIGSCYNAGCTITISGGTVTATGGEDGAGIGGNYNGEGSNITISGGTVTATGGENGAGIGGGRYKAGSNITISGGTVTATGGEYGAGIGGGDNGAGSNITISGEIVTSTGGIRGAGIGGGREGAGSNITISGGIVTSTGGREGAGIGGGSNGSGNNIKIENASVKAVAGYDANDFGGGSGCDAVIPLDHNDGDNVYLVCLPHEDNLTIKYKLHSEEEWNTIIFPEKHENDERFYLYLKEGVYDLKSGTAEYLYVPVGTYGEVASKEVSTRKIIIDELVLGDELTIVSENCYKIGNVVYDCSDATDGYFIEQRTSETLNKNIVVKEASKIIVKNLNLCPENKATFFVDSESDVEIYSDAESESIFKSPKYHAGIEKAESTGMLILDGEGSITAIGGVDGAGIGGGYQGAGNNITINGGIVTATGGEYGAGIGGGDQGEGSNITINGGIVTATGGYCGAGIGGGYHGEGSNITISGGTVTAIGKAADGIGSTTKTSDIFISGGSIKTDSIGCTPVISESDSTELILVEIGGYAAGDVFPFTSIPDAKYYNLDGVMAHDDGHFYFYLPEGVDVSKYKVQFVNTGNSEIPDQIVMSGDKVLLPDEPVREGCSFRGWYKSEHGGSDIDKWNFDNDVVRGDVILYGGWIVPVSRVLIKYGNEEITEATINRNEKLKLDLSFSPDDTTDKSVSWSSSDETVATVDGTGLVTAKAGGSAVITVTTNDGGKTDTCEINVVVPVSGVSVSCNGKKVTKIKKERSATVQLNAYVTPEDATDKSVIWSSSDETVAVVDNNGLVTAIEAGSAVITARTSDGDYEAECEIEVFVPVSGISISVNDICVSDFEIEKNDKRQLTAYVMPSDASDKAVIWSSSDETIATVSSTGMVTAKAGGNAVITAKTNDGGKTASCNVTVIVSASGVSISCNGEHTDNIKTDITDTVQLNANVFPSDATNKNVSWSTSDETVATVNTDGLVTPADVGNAVITVTSEDGSYTAECSIEVVISVGSVSISCNGKSISDFMLEKNDTKQLNACVLPLNATDKSVVWSSSDETVATVNSEGLVTAKKEGTAVIRVTTTDGGKSDSCGITVPTHVDTVSISCNGEKADALKLERGENEQLFAYISPLDTTDKSVSWYSSDEDILTIDSEGIVTAQAKGTAIVTVTTSDGGKTATCEIEVIVPVKAVSISSNGEDISEITLEKDATKKLDSYVTPLDATDSSVSWNSSDETVATVDNTGLVTSKKEGTAVISVVTADGGFEDTCTVLVPTHVEGVSISRNGIAISSMMLEKDDSEQLNAFVIPSDATDDSVIWSSSDEDIAVVDATGLVTAKKEGVAVIIVKTTDGEYTDSCTVTVPTHVKAVSVSYNGSAASLVTLEKTETTKLTAYISPADATDKSVTWTSSASDIVSVDEEGYITAVAEGSAVISVVTDDGGRKASCRVTVPKHVSGVVIKRSGAEVSSISIERGKTAALSAYVSPDDADDRSVTWYSADESVATVSSNGLITAVAKGQTAIYARTNDGGYRASCTVNVIVPVEGVTIKYNEDEVSELTLDVNNGTYLNAAVYPYDANNKNVAWTSSDESVVSIDAGGYIETLKEGTAVITAITVDGNKKAKCTVNVVIPVSSLSISCNGKDAWGTQQLKKGKTAQLNANIYPVEATDKSVTWSSSAPEIAEVDENGVVTGKKDGEVEITATCNTGGRTATLRFVVLTPEIILSKDTLTLEMYASDKLTYSSNISYSSKELIWSSSNEEIVRVDGDGNVSAGGKTGNAVITLKSEDCSAECTVKVTELSADDTKYSGEGWRITNGGVLVITGDGDDWEGPVTYYYSSLSRRVPEWIRYSNDIEYVRVDAGSLGTTTSYWFYRCSNIRQIDFVSCDTSKVTDMSYMFYYCNNLESLDLSGFDTSKVTDMSSMFYDCADLRFLDVSNFNTSKVTSMYYMFGDCWGLESIKISGFNTENVKDMDSMFSYCSNLKNIDLSSFNTSRVTSMYAMFSGCRSLNEIDISGFDMSNVENTGNMFAGCTSLEYIDLSSINSACASESMFSGCTALAKIKSFTGLDHDVSLPVSPMYDAKGNVYRDHFPMDLVTAVMLYKERVSGGVPAVKISLTENELALGAKRTHKLKLTVEPANTTEDAVWTSSDTSVLTVAQDGTVTAGKKAGEATINVRVGKLKESCTVTVSVPAEDDEEYYKVIFNANNGTGDEETDYFKYAGDVIPSTELLYPAFKLKNWNTEADGSGTVYYTGDQISRFAEDGNLLTLYAQWIFDEENKTSYIISYNGDGAQGTMEDSLFDRGLKYTLRKNAFTRRGYAFTGWNTKADGSGTTYADGAEVSDLAGADQTFTLYAMWKIANVTVKPDIDMEAGTGEDRLVCGQKIDISSYFPGASRYSSDNRSVATVNNKGIVTVKKGGKVKTGYRAVISAYKKNGKMIELIGTYAVDVEKPEIISKTIKLNPYGVTYDALDNVTGCDLMPTRWESSKPEVASIDERTGLITTGSKAGSAKITLYYGEGKTAAKYKFTVKVVKPKLSRTKLKLKGNGAATLILKDNLDPAGAEAIVWKTGDEAVATVDENGVVTAKGNGETVVTAVLNGQEYGCRVTVSG